MSSVLHPDSKIWPHFSGPNLGYLLMQYERYLENPQSVDAQYREAFERWGEPEDDFVDAGMKPPAPDGHGASVAEATELHHKAVLAGKLVAGIRDYGHLAANIDPLDLGPSAKTNLLDPANYQLNLQDLAALPASQVWKDAPYSLRNGREAIEKLLEIYTGTIAFDFNHVHDEEERRWLNRQAEAIIPAVRLTAEEQRKLLVSLIRTEQFEQFLHRTFAGQKRFSVEGVDVLIPMVEEIVHELANDGARHILMGMAHRGRLNVLAHVLGKSYEAIFSEFQHATDKQLHPSEGSIGFNSGWTGDVKYHLGANRFIPSGETAFTRLTLANNPSHLEFVNPVVAGFTRAAQEDRSKSGPPVQRQDVAAAIVMHGDAAFPGEGIVAETLNFNNLAGFSTGGTIHIIVNNRIGFTTAKSDARSTRYASDLAKGFEIPVIHVNADDAEACIAAARLAAGYRSRFHKDFLIDLVGYRRHGHNEADDPETTQPLMYRKIKSHPTVAQIYASHLVKSGTMTEAEIEKIRQESADQLKSAYESVKQSDNAAREQQSPPAADSPDVAVETAVPLDRLRQINASLQKWPEDFNVYPKLRRILERRATALDEDGSIDWGHAETLAFATILADGRPIRMSGQDVQRATFAHRNLVLHDYENGRTFCPLHALPEARASFAIYNSPLSEAGVLGFEYGYNVYAPETMVIWEAQFGDFANAAQVIIDQFISSGFSKWKQRSSLILLLPHGYEGQGPEHSSARLERFLQLSAENNWKIACLTNAAQYFHLLRHQAAICGTEAAQPLVLMAPKSLIRNPKVAVPARALSSGTFRKVLEPSRPDNVPERAKRLILCTGKIALELEEALEEQDAAGGVRDWLYIARVEQLYPLPEPELRAIIGKLPNLQEICWVQEEPHNMGAWQYIEPHLRRLAPEHAAVRYIGRPEHASPASGFQQVHRFEQQSIISRALAPLTPTMQTTGGKPND